MLERLNMINPYVPRLSPEKGWRAWSEENSRVVAFAGFWELQAKCATVALLVLWETLGWEALLIMICWAILMTLVYELAILSGLEDLTKTPERSLPSWGIRLPILWFTVGIVPFLYTQFHQRVKSSDRSGLRSKLTVAFGLVMFGVIPSRRLLIEEGVEKHRLKISLLGRFANVPLHLGETKGFLFVILIIWGLLETNVPITKEIMTIF